VSKICNLPHSDPSAVITPFLWVCAIGTKSGF
jgi:hypothetical protein